MCENLPTFITECEAESLLNWPSCFEACEQALLSVCNEKGDNSQPSSQNPLRTWAFVEQQGALAYSMLGYIENYKLKTIDPDKVFDTLCHKLGTSFPRNKNLAKPLPIAMSAISLFDTKTGMLKTMIESKGVTAWRTAGACMVATKYLYFDRNEQNKGDKALAIIGCGVQGRIHAIGISSMFPINEIHLYNRSPGVANNLKKELEGMSAKFHNKNVKVFVHESVRDCVKTADIIVTATQTKTPLIFADMLKENVHINAVGASNTHYAEIDLAVYKSSKLYADSVAGAKGELKGLDCPCEGAVGEIINKSKAVTKHPRTIFHSLGMAVTDAAVAQVVEALHHKKK